MKTILTLFVCLAFLSGCATTKDKCDTVCKEKCEQICKTEKPCKPAKTNTCAKEKACVHHK